MICQYLSTFHLEREDCRITYLDIENSESTKSITRTGKGRVRVDGDGGDNGGHNNEYTLRLRTNTPIDPSTSVDQVKVKYDVVDDVWWY